MVPYSLSACQVVRVFCAVLRALGTSPIMSLEIVFLTGALAPCPLFGLRATSLLKDFLEFRAQRSHTKNNHVVMACSVRLQGNRRELISDQHVYLDPIAMAQRVICGDLNVSS
eukprot:scaffold5612_cov210-Skeletonema_marinoi.AAC.1